MRHGQLALALAVVACGGGSTRSTLPIPALASTPADDLAAASSDAPRVDPAQAGLVARDPRVVDLDIIRIRATSTGIGGEPELTSVASADLFAQANEAARTGRPRDAITRYRQLLGEFPESLYAPVALFNIAAVHDGLGELEPTITTLRELVASYPAARESIDGHLYIAALQADHRRWPDAVATIDAILARTSLTFSDRVEAFARKGFVLIELGQNTPAEAALAAAVAEWRKAPRIEDPYYIAMAHYYRGELVHRAFRDAPVRRPDDQLVADLDAKRVLAVTAYDRWKDALGFRHAYWATAAGYQMSQIFLELWEAHVKAPYPTRIAVATRPTYVAEVHARVRPHLAKALEGHRMNVELAKAFGVDTSWSRASEQRAIQIMELIQQDARGSYVTPP